MRLKLKIDELSIKYRIYFLIASTAVLCFYSFLNFTVTADLFKAYECLCLAVIVIFQIYYILQFKSAFLNHFIELSAFILLLLLTPIFGTYPERGRMWLFILPLVTFYTQGIKKGKFFIIGFLILAAITYLLSAYNYIKAQNPYSKEQIFVFILITIVAGLYEMVLDKNTETINKQLYIDALTGFANRRKLIKDLRELGSDESVIVVLINIDDFKEVNDLFGAATGDSVIYHLGSLLKKENESIGNSRFYRLHADEFAVMLPCDEKEKCDNFVSRLIQGMTTPFVIGTDEISITVSIGVSVCSTHPLEEADMALQKAKERNKHVVYFDSSLKTIERYNSNRLILLELRKAIKNDSISPFFQPIYDNTENRITRFEALVRIVDTDKVYSPASFLEISQRSKIYPHITQQMVKKTFAAFMANDYSFSINISRDDIFNNETVQLIYSELEKFNSPHRVIFELLETEQIEACEEVYAFVSNVKKYGCKIAVDDFGSGYSNFNYLLSLNADIIKIDASLIKNIHEDFNSFTITRNIINFAREMHIKTIAEFVHSESVFSTIRRLNVDFAQGYYIGKPEPELFDTPAFSRLLETDHI